jgi:hypothetical protein
MFSLGLAPYSMVAFDQMAKYLMDENRMTKPQHTPDDV